MEAVVAADRIAEEERSRPALARGGGVGEEGAQLRRVALLPAERRGPAVRDRREMAIGMRAQPIDQRRERAGEVAVLADAEAVARHVDGAAEVAIVGVE